MLLADLFCSWLWELTLTVIFTVWVQGEGDQEKDCEHSNICGRCQSFSEKKEKGKDKSDTHDEINFMKLIYEIFVS